MDMSLYRKLYVMSIEIVVIKINNAIFEAQMITVNN
jgi:hypothetical protein